MTPQPYRELAATEPDPPADADAARLGPLRSVHAPPPLLGAMVGPALIAGMVLAAAGLLGAPLVAAAAAGVVALIVLVVPPLRTLGQSVALHAAGLVVTRRGSSSVVPFDEVNEVWFDVPAFHTRAGAHLRAMRLLDFEGRAHHVPMAMRGGLDLALAILRGCSEPLLREARRALAEGAPLTFAGAQLDRHGLTIHGAKKDWGEIRLAVVSHARLHLYGRTPLLAWRTIRLDRVPNPAVLASLVAQCAGRARIDDALILPFAGDSKRAQGRWSSDAGAAMGDIKAGALACAVGGVVTLVATSMVASNHGYVVAFGPILYGLVRLVRGGLAWLRAQDR